MIEIKRLPAQDAAAASRWDSFVMSCPQASFFHRAGSTSESLGKILQGIHAGICGGCDFLQQRSCLRVRENVVILTLTIDGLLDEPLQSEHVIDIHEQSF